MTKEQTGSTTVSQGVEIDTDLLTSFTMVNFGLAHDAAVVATLRRRVTDVDNHKQVNLAEALSDGEDFAFVDEANDAAIDSVLHEMACKTAD